MPALLFLHALLQLLHELVPAAHGLDLRLLLLGEEALGQKPQPFLGDLGVGRIAEQLQPFEDGGKDPVELVEIALVFDQRRARQIVEILDPLLGKIGLDRLHQR